MLKSNTYTKILHEELKIAMGCTEPIAISYGAAYARKILGRMPERFEVLCSSSIIKNASAAVIPNTNGLKGIEAATIVGAMFGDPDKKLETLANINNIDIEKIKDTLKLGIVKVKLLESKYSLHIIVNVFSDNESASVELFGKHTNIGEVVHNGEIVQKRMESQLEEEHLERQVLNIKDILKYADTVELDDIRELLEKQIEYNHSISKEGLSNVWGANVGKTMLCYGCDSVWTRAKAAAAAASDARMNGCALPVIINSGSGNQGITASLPVIIYARENDISHDKLLRALCVSNLTAIHQKTDIGSLSAFCGVVCAATGAMAGIAYLEGAAYEVIYQAIINSLANVGGMICDGAKSSCAGKIVSSLESAFLGYELAKNKRGFLPGEGIVKEDVEKTIASIGRLAKKGMYSTDIEILNIMIGN